MSTPDISEIRESRAPDRFYARARKRVLFIICFGFFLVLLDTTALNIATPALGKEFGDGISDLQWVVNSYTLVFATSRLLGRRNGARYLRPRIVVGLALAAIGSAILAVATFDAILWPVPAGLGILGISMGSIMPAMTAGVLTSSPPENSGLASGLLNSTRQVGGTIGVALLGTIMQTLPSAWGVICALIVASLVLLCGADLSRRTLR